MSRKFLLALDQGTTGSTSLVLDLDLKVRGRAYREIPLSYPQPGWVSQDPEQIWALSLEAMRAALAQAGVEASQLAALGLTNQRETTILWERGSGRPVTEAVVWQCRRSAGIVEGWRPLEQEIQERTGLIPDAYFSASKIRWLLENTEGLEERCQRGDICFGTVDSWLLYRLTGGRVHAIEASNASRTMLFNLTDMDWDSYLCRQFGIPEEILPRVRPSDYHYGDTQPDLLGGAVPITGIAGDQQAALFGQACFAPGDVKNTYGTGCFIVMNTGRTPFTSRHRLLTTVAWQLGDEPEYALEGSVFSAGSAVQWLRDGLGLISSAAETEELARSVPDTGGVFMVPAFNGLGAPYWDMYARAAVLGLTRGSSRAHLARAVLEAVAYQTRDVVEAMVMDSGRELGKLRADGGMAANSFLLQFQADILGVPVERPAITESTALGAAALAGLGAGVFADPDEVAARRQVEATFAPRMGADERESRYREWTRAVARVRSGGA
jgi:glycerol kinase